MRAVSWARWLGVGRATSNPISTPDIPVQPRNSTVQCIFLAHFTTQVLPFLMSRPIPDKNCCIARPDRHYSVSTAHYPLFSALCFHPLANPFSHLPSHIDFYFLYFHPLTNPLAGKTFVFTSMQNSGVSPTSVPEFPMLAPHKRVKSFVFILLQTLGRREKSHLHWNQQLPHSFAKTPGVGWGRYAHSWNQRLHPQRLEPEQGITDEGKRT